MNTLPIHIYTKDELIQYKLSLEQVQKELYSASNDLHQIASNVFDTDQNNSFFSMLSEHNISPENTVRVNEFLARMIDGFAGVPVVTLRVAVQPSRQMIADVHAMLKKQLTSDVVIDVVVDPSVVAGASVAYNGKSFTYSVL